MKRLEFEGVVLEIDEERTALSPHKVQPDDQVATIIPKGFQYRSEALALAPTLVMAGARNYPEVGSAIATDLPYGLNYRTRSG